MASKREYYEVLGVDKNASQDDIKKAFRKAAKEKFYVRRYGLKYNIRTDADIIAWLSRQPSIQGYIKRLIRADISAHGGLPDLAGDPEDRA